MPKSLSLRCRRTKIDMAQFGMPETSSPPVGARLENTHPLVCQGLREGASALRVAGAPIHRERSRVEKGVYPDALLLRAESHLEHLDGDCVCPGLPGLLGVLFWPSVWLFFVVELVVPCRRGETAKTWGITNHCRVTPSPLSPLTTRCPYSEDMNRISVIRRLSSLIGQGDDGLS